MQVRHVGGIPGERVVGLHHCNVIVRLSGRFDKVIVKTVVVDGVDRDAVRCGVDLIECACVILMWM